MILHEHAGARALGMLRAWVFGLWAALVALDPLHRIADLPLCAFNPPGILRLFPVTTSLLEPAALTALRVAIVLACVAAALGIRGRAAAVFAALLLVIEQGLLRGFGHVNHSELPMLWTAVLLPFFPCGDAFALVPGRSGGSSHRAGVVLVTLVFLCTYVFAGVHRIAAAPSVLVTDAVRTWALESSYLDPWPWSATTRAWVATPAGAFFGAAGMIVVTVLEVLAPLALFSRRFRLAFLGVMLVFHLGAWVFMNILFLETMLMLPILIDSPQRPISTTAPTGSAP